MTTITPYGALPFDRQLLDQLLDEHGVDALFATSKHNVQYLLGGYRSNFFQHFDALGLSRYLPILVYVRGSLDASAFFGTRLSSDDARFFEFWPRHNDFSSMTTTGAMSKALEHLKKTGLDLGRIALESPFLPFDAAGVLRTTLPHAELVDATVILEQLRAVKTPAELQDIKYCSEQVVDAMLVAFATSKDKPKKEIVTVLRQEETKRGLDFEYCLVSAGKDINRYPSQQLWGREEVLSLDSGATYNGYIGDLCRMGFHGHADAQLQDLLADIDEIQQVARAAVRAGTPGGEIYRAVEPILSRNPGGERIHFLAHGVGLISHEAPRLTSTGPVPYPGDDAAKPLEAGMVLSIETTHRHARGLIKLEDTIAVTSEGYEAFGDHGRGWN